jgi:hypothetical protein
MTEQEIVDFVHGLGDTVVVVASEVNGAPEVAWGDTFFFYDRDGITVPEKRLPYATIVVNDYPGFDEASDLARPGVYRVNASVSKQTFETHTAQIQQLDYRVIDQVIPHPVYGAQNWLSVLSPGIQTSEIVKSILTEAHGRARARYDHQLGSRP